MRYHVHLYFCLKLLFLFNQHLSAIASVQNSDVIDLTWSFSDETVYWPGIQPFKFTKKVAETKEDDSWYSMNEFCAGEHGGTHLDAPYHFSKTGWKVGEIPLSRLVVPGVLIDVPKQVQEVTAQSVLLPEHLEKWEMEHGAFPDNCVVLVRFGWSKYYANRTRYLGFDRNGSLNFPGLSKSAADWIVRSENIIGVGIDTASIDPGSTVTYDAHKILGRNHIYILENVNIPYTLPADGFLLYVMPMKIAEGTGAPLRVIAVVQHSTTNENYYTLIMALLIATALSIAILFLLIFVYCLYYKTYNKE